MGLSLRAVVATKPAAPQVENYKQDSHKHPVSSSTTTLGDLINWRKSEASKLVAHGKHQTATFRGGRFSLLTNA